MHNEELPLILDFSSNTFGGESHKPKVNISLHSLSSTNLFENKFINVKEFNLNGNALNQLNLQYNEFGNFIPVFDLWNDVTGVSFLSNHFQLKVNLNIQGLDDNTRITWPQFSNKLISLAPTRDYSYLEAQQKDPTKSNINGW